MNKDLLLLLLSLLLLLYIKYISLYLQSKIESREYSLGEMIVPQTYKKVVLTEDGIIKTVSGEKYPSDIRERTRKQHEKLGLMHVHTDEYYAGMTKEQVYERIAQLNESTNCPEKLFETY